MLRPESPDTNRGWSAALGASVGADGQDESFDRLSRVAAQALGVASARIVVGSGEARRVVGRAGRETSCGAVARLDAQVAATGEPVVVADPAAAALKGGDLAAYAGVPLRTAEGGVVGVMAVVDDRPRSWSESELGILADLATAVAREMELRTAVHTERERVEVLGVAQELYVRRLAEADQFRHLVELSLAGIYLVQDGRILYCNARMAEIFGYAHEELLAGTPVGQLVHPEDRDRVEGRVRRRLEGAEGEDPNFCFRGLRKDGSTVEVEVFGSLTRADGRPAILGTMLDMTDRNRALRALRESDCRNRFLARASALLDRSLDPAVTLERLARLCVPALADCCLIDLAEDDGSLRRVALVHRDKAREAALQGEASYPPDADADRYLAVRAVRTKEPILIVDVAGEPGERIAFDPAHHEALVGLGLHSLMVLPLVARGRVAGAILMATTADSGRRYGRAELVMAKDLARRAGMATDNARLYAAAQRAIQARDEVLRVVSHDLRNPLNTIHLAAALLIDTGEERRHDNLRQLDMIRRTALHMNDMIQDLLDVSTLESGHFAVDRSDHDIASVLEHACELLEPLARHAGIELVRDVAGALPEVAIDGPRIQRVFSNLVGNAIKFTPRGGRITIRAEARPDSVEFSIQDTGPGIPDGQRVHVFDRFWQARRGDRRGSGLGLAICKGIVEAHNGRIWVESAEGHGATFAFTIPLQDAAA